MRPGGLELTEKMLAALRITSKDDVVEFAPGLGVTARTVLAKRPASVVGIERDAAAAEWREMLEAEGFVVESCVTVPMALLEPMRMLRDEGVRGVAKILVNVVKNPGARKRILEMRKSFQKHADNMSAVAIVAVKP